MARRRKSAPPRGLARLVRDRRPAHAYYVRIRMRPGGPEHTVLCFERDAKLAGESIHTRFVYEAPEIAILAVEEVPG